MSSRLHSTHGVETLISSACAAYERQLLAQTFSPLFPEACPWGALSELPKMLAAKDEPRLSVLAAALAEYRAGLTETAGQLARYLDASEGDIRDLALEYARYHLPGLQKLEWAARLLGAPVPGETPQTQFARVNDARFWRRAIRTRLLREREHFYLRLRLVGKQGEAYVSDVQLSTRQAQLRRQAQWMKETCLLPRYLVTGEAEKSVLTLEQVASSPKSRFAKLYAFTKAMDEIAQEEGLAAAMLTLTNEPKWHPNPSHGTNSWNGASPREAHRHMGTRWQSVLRDLDRLGVGLSGLRMVEPHKDGCPHWHIWLLYRPEAEAAILATVMKYFPNKLKVRAPSKRGETNHAGDRMYDTRAELLAGQGRPLTHAKEGSQVELSRIDRTISSGPSYATKYLLKTVDAGDSLNQEVGLFPASEDKAALQAKKQKHQATTKRVDAYRSLWGINAGQLFGVAKCLTAWDELRRLQTAPSHPELKALWVLARGSDKEGRIDKNAGQRGDAKAFIQALGGLAACSKPAKGAVRRSIGRLTDPAVNGYGESIERTQGVTLIERTRQRVAVDSRVNKQTGEIKDKLAWRSVKTVVAAVRTRLTEWVLTPKKTLAAAIELAEARYRALMTQA